MSRSFVVDALDVFGKFVIVYFTVYIILMTILTILGWIGLKRYTQMGQVRLWNDATFGPMSYPVSIVVPAFNEESMIIGAIESLLTSQLGKFEVVVVNDGSTDGTERIMIKTFDMVPSSRTPLSDIPAKPVVAVYESRKDSRILLVSKENGRKADSNNVGINYAQHPLVCVMDADSIIDPWGLARMVWLMQINPEAVCVSGMLRVLNGCELDENRHISSTRVPKDMLSRIQVIEYLRAYYSRVGWNILGAMPIVSGGFGVFRRDVVVSVGGYDSENIGEDAELTFRLHRSYPDRPGRRRIILSPDPVCWTEVPHDMKSLRRQRDRWHRGIFEVLWKHRRMTLNPRHGSVGMVSMPYFWAFEFLGPLFEGIGYILLILGLVYQAVWIEMAVVLALFSLGYALLLSAASIVMEQRSYNRYQSWIDIWRLLIAMFVENLGYRQYLVGVRLWAMLTLWRGTQWHSITRSGSLGNDVPEGTVEEPS